MDIMLRRQVYTCYYELRTPSIYQVNGCGHNPPGANSRRGGGGGVVQLYYYRGGCRRKLYTLLYI